MREEKHLLSKALIEENIISNEKMQEVLEEHKKTGGSIGHILLRFKYITQKDLLEFFEKKLKVSYANLSNYLIDPNIVKIIPKNIAIQYKLIAILKVRNTLNVAMVDPLDSFVIDSIRQITGCDIKPFVSTEGEISDAIEKFYSLKVKVKELRTGVNSLKNLTSQMHGIEEIDMKNLDSITLNDDGAAPVIKLVNLVMERAVEYGASDIHIEPGEKSVRTRFRIDGMLQEVMSLPKRMELTVVSRIKVISGLDISEKRIPQDGRVKIKTTNKELDVRVSTFPTVHGEKIVMRILDKQSVLFSLEDLGFSRDIQKRFETVITKPNGIILVTGPTGSGKSTTLYAALDRINSVDKNIVTIEDPVEYQLPLINQSQVNPKAGYDFAGGLRSVLRQDPDVVMVGEIRDYETAETAIRAALTGHLVFSTVHTNDAAGAVTRLIDMGVEPFLVASSVICMMAQRLVRTICPDCKTAVNIKPEVLEKIFSIAKVMPSKNQKIYVGKGCEKCKFTGYKGRIAINELLLPNEKIRELIVNKSPTSVIKNESRNNGMYTLREDGLRKVLDGATTVEEVIRVTQMDEN
ncbi:MAG: Flp pilus assembly complex ATPase component TadA [Candidatus Muirbacterium halophilum]|nr:Flp pilus assembly complex ATPase component TadA [Candidatus Muirbacterium halophilum]MCK9475465.1 Flp pilus assembly complex ATPase component TadA [Candidatus Muirbacterium halophilum]